MWAANQTDDKIVHRDISPSNIIVYRSSAQNSPGSVQTAQPHDERKGYLVDWDLACPAEMTFDDRNPPYSVSRICIPTMMRVIHDGLDNSARLHGHLRAHQLPRVSYRDHMR